MFIPKSVGASGGIVDDNYTVFGDRLVLTDTYKKDLVAVGNEVEIKGKVGGDLFVAADKVKISGIVVGNVWLAAGQAELFSQVGGSVRGVADKIIVKGEIGKNLFIRGGRLAEVKSKVGWDAYLNAYQVKLSGQARRADIKANKLTVDGKFEYIVVKSKDSSSLVKIGDSARINDLTVLSAAEPVMAEGARVNKLNIKTISKTNLFYDDLFKWIVSVFSLLAVGLLLFYFTRNWLQHSAELLSEELGKNFIWGVGWIVLAPLVVFVLFLTTIGIPLAAMLLVVWASGFYLAQVLSSFWLGRMIYFRLRNKPALTPEDYAPSSLLPLVIGVVAFKSISALPLLGQIFFVLAIIVASGSGVRVIWSYIKE